MRQNESNIVPYFPFVLSDHRKYFSPSGMDAELILEELAVKEIGTQSCVATCTNEKPGRRALEAISRFTVLKMKLKQSLSHRVACVE